MNYLDRPVFLFSVNWAKAVTRKISFDLRPEDIGYGVEYFTPLQLWTVNSWQFYCDLANSAAVFAYDGFTAALIGPLNGFWLPVPVQAATILAGASTSVFTIVGEQLSSFWQDRPSQYLFFQFSDGTQACAQIQSVVVAGGNETITLTAPLPEVPDENTMVNLLHYVRLASDEESGEFYMEGRQRRQANLVELPTEYAAAQLGLQPIYLFDFFANAPISLHWRYTSFAAPVVSGGSIFTNWPIDFKDLVHVSDGTTDDLQIEAKFDPAMPLALFVPVEFSGTLYVNVYVVDYSTPNNATLLFSGRVVVVEDLGTKLQATCESRLGFLKRKVPRYLKGQTCQNVLYDQKTCKAARAFFETTVNIVSTDNTDLPPTVVCTFAYPAFAAKFQAANYLVSGQFESGVGTNYETRTIIASSWNAGTGQLNLTLNLPLYKTQAGAQAQIVRGCDHASITCDLVFDNFQNFNGFLAIPSRNPVLSTTNANQVSAGGK